MTVHQRLDKNDILVLTPKILENHLRPDKIPSLSAFSLLIFDECHHTRKGEPYNSVMKHYLKSKEQRELGLPQVCQCFHLGVGVLTDPLGVGVLTDQFVRRGCFD